MCKIERIEVMQVDLIPKVVRTDAIQAFTKQETPIVRLTTDDGIVGTGYAYTVGTGGSAVVAMLRDDIAPKLLGRDPALIEQIWKDLFFHVHANAIGATVSLSLAAIDLALWDIRCQRAGEPLWRLAGGAQERLPLYSTEGGWLNFTTEELVDGALEAKEQGFLGCKPKVGKPNAAEDVARLEAVREAVGSDFAVMVDANQVFTVPEAIRRARLFEPLDLAWFEEPMPAEDMRGHMRLSASTSLPIAIGESLYHPNYFREYLANDACSIVQVDVARIGGITPWLKVAHIAESFNIPVCPHYLMEIHVSLCAAVPNARWVEYIPQLTDLTTTAMRIEDGYAYPPDAPGIGIAWDMSVIEDRRVEGSYAEIRMGSSG
jgi:L-alanine-DL-glutamate epimerase-like enolase superfamily enzyme